MATSTEALTALVETDEPSEKESKLQLRIEEECSRITKITITDAASYTQVAELAQIFREGIRAVEEDFKEEKGLLNRLKTKLLDRIKKYSQPYELALQAANRMLSDWNRKQEEIRREQQAAAEQAAKAAREQQAIQEAARLEREGDNYGAQQVIQDVLAAPAPAVVVQKATPKVAGTHFRKGKFRFEVTDQSKIKQQFLMTVPDEAQIKVMVERHGLNAIKIVGEGIKVWQEDDKPVHVRR